MLNTARSVGEFANVFDRPGGDDTFREGVQKRLIDPIPTIENPSLTGQVAESVTRSLTPIITGAGLGAALGSFVPFLGTGIGASIGGVAGALGFFGSTVETNQSQR